MLVLAGTVNCRSVEKLRTLHIAWLHRKVMVEDFRTQYAFFNGPAIDCTRTVRTYVDKAAGRPGPHAALNLAANSSSRALFSRQLSTVIVNVETCSDCGKRILLCIPFLISNHLPYAVSIQSFFHLPTLLLCS